MKNVDYYKTVRFNTFGEMINGMYYEYGDRVAIKYYKSEVVEILYKDLVSEIGNLYNYFKINSIKNKNIGIISENRYEYITLYLSSVFDNVICPIDKEVTSEDLKNIVDKFDIDVLLYTNKMKSKIGLLNKLKTRLINIDQEYKTMIGRSFDTESFIKSVKKCDRNKFSVLVFTSGTTDQVKGVMLSQYNILSNLRAAVENNHLKNPTLSVLPMNHTYGFNPGVLNTLYNGTTLCLNLDLKYIVRDLKMFNPYFIAVVPMMVEGMYKNIIATAKRTKKYNLLMFMIKISNFLRKFKIDLRHLFFGNILNKRLRLMVSGGASLNPYFVEKFDEIGIMVLNGYGLSECSPLVAVNRHENNVIGSVGTIIKDDNVKIEKDGEILVKGPNVMLGYYKDEKENKKSFKNGYFKTGDFGYKDGNILYVTGRKKNLIILENGKNFSPEVIEEKILSLEYVKECLVVSRKKKNASVIVALVYMEEVNDKLDDDIKKINSTLPSYMNIDHTEIMECEFEKNSSKKIIRSKYVK